VWLGALNEKGYPIVTLDGLTRRAHRAAYEQAKGPIPAGMHLDHVCRNRSCINPDHLEPVTSAENTRRGLKATRITPSIAATIRDRYAAGGVVQRELAAEFDVSIAQISRIVTNKRWAGVA
jgi:hypothetical protein